MVTLLLTHARYQWLHTSMIILNSLLKLDSYFSTHRVDLTTCLQCYCHYGSANITKWWLI